MKQNNFYWSYTSSSGDCLFSNIPDELNNIDDRFELNKISTISINVLNFRCFYNKLGEGYLLIISLNDKHLKSRKSFEELIIVVTQVCNDLINRKQSLQKENENFISHFIHNLTSLNTYNIQELFSLIPQDKLSNNINDQKETVKNIILSKPNVTSETLLKLIKYNLAMKVEFSVFSKTNSSNSSVQKIETDLRSFILQVLQIFIDDFDKRQITVSIEANSSRLFFDTELLFVSLFYILDNSTKYCIGNSSLKIIFKEDGDYLDVIFDMISTKIEENELNKIFDNNFRCDMAKKLTSNGEGIGMYRIKKTLNLNNIDISIKPNVSDLIKTKNGISYHHNQILLKFNKKRIL